MVCLCEKMPYSFFELKLIKGNFCLVSNLKKKFTFAITAVVKTAKPTITATRYWAILKHVLLLSFSDPTGFSWNGSHVSLRHTQEQHIILNDFSLHHRYPISQIQSQLTLTRWQNLIMNHWILKWYCILFICHITMVMIIIWVWRNFLVT